MSVNPPESPAAPPSIPRLSIRGMDSVRSSKPRKWDGGHQWPSPQFVVGDFLEELGVELPRRVAATLLGDFGSISGVLSASWWQLRRSVGLQLAGVICACRNVMQASLVEKVSRGPVVTSRQELLDLLKLQLGASSREAIIALYLDAGMHLLRIEQLAEGTPRICELPVARLIHIGLDVGAAGIILVHNHPSGDPTPSQTDRQTTMRVSAIVRDLDMHLLDHLVVAGGKLMSCGHL
jgi:DNA repair protein RadC